MPWSTPTLRDVRSLVRDAVNASLPGADASVPNSVLRVLSDNQGALCHLTLQYIDWLALQLLPDTAETEWLDRHGDIWLVNSDGSTGRKLATLASGIATFEGSAEGALIPTGTQLRSAVGAPPGSPSTTAELGYETLEDIVVGSGFAEGPIRALDPGALGNLDTGSVLSMETPPANVSPQATVVTLTGGTDTETDDQLRARILQRIRNPAMGGSQENYVTWALAVPGVERAWAAPEQGPGTITVRFLMDRTLRPPDGWPLPEDVVAVKDYIDLMRPVTVKDSYVVAPIKQFVDVTIKNLVPDDWEEAIRDSLDKMLYALAATGQTIYAAWISYAIMNTAGVQSFQLVTTDDVVMPSLGHMGVLGTVLFEYDDPVP
jgi:uncharacterized phage protein gp47/JayE